MEIARQRARRRAAALLLAFVAAAPHAWAQSAASPHDPASVPTSSPASTPAAAAAAAAKKLRVATSGDYAPFSFASAPEMLDGFDVEVAREFARDRGYEVELVRFRWPDLGRELAAGSFDVAMGGVTVKAERSIAGRYTIPVAAAHAVAITWRGSGCEDGAELDRPSRRIAVNAGGHLESVARRVFRRAEVVAIADNEAVRMALLDRAFDAVLTDDFEEKIWTAGVDDVVRIGPFSDDRKAYLLPADRGALAAELDQWLLAREKDGTLARLRTRYFGAPAAAVVGSSTTVATATPLAALVAAIGERQALMPMVYDAKREAGKRLEDREQEAAVVASGVGSVREAASAANETPPSDEAVEPLFQALIAASKDVQFAMAADEARFLPADAAGAVEKANGDLAAVAAEVEKRPAPKTGRRLYDLASELRPAIARITEKIARLVVAFDAPVDVRDARRALQPLVDTGLGAPRADEIAAAIAVASRGAAPAP